MICDLGVDLVKQLEGFKEAVYKDVGGIKTIGYGHVILKNEKLTVRITGKQAEIILNNDLKKAELSVRVLVKVHLNEHQMAALTSFAFNVGTHAFAHSHLLKSVNSGNLDAIKKDFLTFCTVKGKRVKGLETRRRAELTLYLLGVK